MKKVLFVATVVKLHIMVFHIPYLEWFKKNGYEVHVCARNDYENKEECNIPFCDKLYDLPYERSPFKLGNIKVYKELKNIIERNNYDIIHCHTPIGGVIGRLAALQVQSKSTKIIYTAHGFHFYKGAPFINWLLYYPIERWLAKHTDVLITINKEDYERAKTFKAKRIEYIPGVGIDSDKFQNIKIDRGEKRKSIGIKNEDFMIISVGELNENKNHQVVIKAIAKLKCYKIKYVICGQGDLEDSLRQLSKELNVDGQIKFLDFRNDITELFKIADLFVFPSFREGLSLALMEAMASGLPVVCSKIRGNTDLIQEGKGGYLVKPKDVERTSELIRYISVNRSISNEMGVYNLKKIKKYEVKNVVEKYVEIIKELI